MNGKEYDLSDFMLNMPNNDEPFVIPTADIPAEEASLYILEAACQYDEDTHKFTFYRYEGYVFR